jgi:hypothetical protein
MLVGVVEGCWWAGLYIDTGRDIRVVRIRTVCNYSGFG